MVEIKSRDAFGGSSDALTRCGRAAEHSDTEANMWLVRGTARSPLYRSTTQATCMLIALPLKFTLGPIIPQPQKSVRIQLPWASDNDSPDNYLSSGTISLPFPPFK